MLASVGTPKRVEFSEAYDDHVWDVYGFLGYRLNSREETEDLTQVTFERAFKAWERFDPARASVKTWLLAIARNAVIDHYRGNRAEQQRPLPEEGDAQLPASAIVEPDERGLGPDPDVARALSRLSDRERELLALRYGGDMTGAEIAEITGLSLANVQQILSRSLRALRVTLEAEERSGDRGAGAPEA